MGVGSGCLTWCRSNGNIYLFVFFLDINSRKKKKANLMKRMESKFKENKGKQIQGK